MVRDATKTHTATVAGQAVNNVFCSILSIAMDRRVLVGQDASGVELPNEAQIDLYRRMSRFP